MNYLVLQRSNAGTFSTNLKDLKLPAKYEAIADSANGKFLTLPDCRLAVSEAHQ